MQKELSAILAETEKVISGKTAVIERLLMAVLADGHVLLDDVPGVGKTTLALAMSSAMDLEYRRVQFTPDVLPSDIVGFSVYDKETGSLSYKPGIASGANLLLGDEINRASSKTQSALLEAMEERQVTVDGHTYPLERPFIVIATQNNVGTAGTQMLPYAQMDRFLIRLSIGYPDRAAQTELLRRRQDAEPLRELERVVSLDRLLAMQKEVRGVHAADSILEYITDLSIASRESEQTEIGISPRGALYLDRMAKARAYLLERDYVIPEDVQNVLEDVCAHRIILTQKARLAGQTAARFLAELLKTVPVPDRKKG